MKSLWKLGAAVMALCVFTSQAHAAHGIFLDDLGIGGGPEVVMVDGVAAGVVTAFGTTTHADAVADGVVSFNGSVAGSVFTVNITTGISKPVIGPYRIDVNSVNVSTAGAGSLRIGHADQGFSLPADTYGVKNLIGGTTDGTVTTMFGANAANGVFSGPAGTQGPFTTSPFSGVATISVALDNEFSISHWATITHTGSGQITSFDMETVVVPEPATVLTWMGLAGLGFVGYRRRRKNA